MVDYQDCGSELDRCCQRERKSRQPPAARGIKIDVGDSKRGDNSICLAHSKAVERESAHHHQCDQSDHHLGSPIGSVLFCHLLDSVRRKDSQGKYGNQASGKQNRHPADNEPDIGRKRKREQADWDNQLSQQWRIQVRRPGTEAALVRVATREDFARGEVIDIEIIAVGRIVCARAPSEIKASGHNDRGRQPKYPPPDGSPPGRRPAIRIWSQI